MSIAKLKQGINKRDWGLVVAAYNAISGDTLELEQEESSPSPVKKRGRPKKTTPAPTPVQKKVQESSGRVNLFVDDMKDHKNLLQKKKERKPPRTGNDRRAFKKVSVQCDRCNRKYQVAPSLAPVRLGKPEDGEDSDSGYICNRCVGK